MTERERQRDRETDTQRHRDRETQRQRERDRERQRDRKTERQRDRDHRKMLKKNLGFSMIKNLLKFSVSAFYHRVLIITRN